METELTAVVADEHQTRVFYIDGEGNKKAFVLDEVRHYKLVERVYDHWIRWHEDRIKEDE